MDLATAMYLLALCDWYTAIVAPPEPECVTTDSTDGYVPAWAGGTGVL